MKTAFQKAIKKEHLIEICKKMHFTLTNEQLQKLEFHFRYTWVCVEFRVKGYGYIAFCVDNHHCTSLMGNKVSKKDIQDALNRGAINFRVWRLYTDEIYKREKQATDFIVANFEKPTVEEFYNDYYSD